MAFDLTQKPFEQAMSNKVDWDGVSVVQGWPEKVKAEQKFTHLVGPRGKMFERIPFHAEHSGHRCHDCATKPGMLHYDGCDMERCPKCHGQLLSCGCNFPKKGWVSK